VPDDFKGNFRVEVDWDSGPFETLQEVEWHSIE
jgi:hypothetical protein